MEGNVSPAVARVRGLGVALVLYCTVLYCTVLYLGVALEVLLCLQLGVLQHALHRVHVVLYISHELHHPGKVDRDQETKECRN